MKPQDIIPDYSGDIVRDFMTFASLLVLAFTYAYHRAVKTANKNERDTTSNTLKIVVDSHEKTIKDLTENIKSDNAHDKSERELQRKHDKEMEKMRLEAYERSIQYVSETVKQGFSDTTINLQRLQDIVERHHIIEIERLTSLEARIDNTDTSLQEGIKTMSASLKKELSAIIEKLTASYVDFEKRLQEVELKNTRETQEVVQEVQDLKKELSNMRTYTKELEIISKNLGE